MSQIRFFLCESMRASVESEAAQRGVKLVEHSASEHVIEFSNRKQEGRLWTEAEGSEDFHALCRVVKKSSFFDRATGMWVKQISRGAFDTYRKERAAMLDRLVEENREKMIKLFGGRPGPEKQTANQPLQPTAPSGRGG